MFTYLTENEFFTKSEDEQIKHEFNYEALGKLTSKVFADKIEQLLSLDHIKRFVYKERDGDFFLWFYAEDGINADNFTIIEAYYKKDYFSVNKIDYSDFYALGLDVSIKKT